MQNSDKPRFCIFCTQLYVCTPTLLMGRPGPKTDWPGTGPIAHGDSDNPAQLGMPEPAACDAVMADTLLIAPSRDKKRRRQQHAGRIDSD